MREEDQRKQEEHQAEERRLLARDQKVNWQPIAQTYGMYFSWLTIELLVVNNRLWFKTFQGRYKPWLYKTKSSIFLYFLDIGYAIAIQLLESKLPRPESNTTDPHFHFLLWDWCFCTYLF